MATSTTPRRANAVPSVTGGELLPPVKPPPWMNTITGNPVAAGSGVQTLRFR